MGSKSGPITILTSLITASALWAGVAAAQVPSVDVGSAAPDNTGKAAVPVNLTSNGTSVGGLQNTIIFDNTILTLTTGGCTINPAIGLNPNGNDCTSDTTVGPCKNLSKAIHQCNPAAEPQGCPAGAGTNLSAFTGIIAATAAPNTNTIPDGLLYTCTFTVANAGALPTSLTNSGIVVSNPTGTKLCSASGTACGGSNGEVQGGGTPGPTNTPGEATNTPTNTVPVSTPTNTVPVSTPTNTVPVVPTATNTPKATNTATAPPTSTSGTPAPTSVSGEDNDGCQIGTTGGGSTWLLLIPAVGLLVMRRRRR